MPKKKSADIEFIRETLSPVSQPRSFHFVMPKGNEWAGIFVGLMFCTLAFFFTVIAPYEGTQESMIAGLTMFSYPFYIFGALIAWSIPTGIERTIQNLSERTLKTKSVSFPAGPNGEKTESSKGTNSEGWLTTPPKIKKWHMDQPYLEDESGLLTDHPINTGTAVPAMFTIRALIILTKGLFLAIMGVLSFQTSQQPNGVIFILIVGLITFVLNYIRVRKWRAISDLPTSRIRSVAVGGVEVYGQIRPRNSWPPVIDVDNDSSKQMFGMGAWSWEYGHSFTWDEWVEERDQEGNVTGGRWESRSRYDKQRSDSGEWPMLVHDGTAGVALQEGLLTGGRRIKSWDKYDDSLWSRRARPTGNVRNVNAKHVWYGTGWSMGDPLFFSGYASPRDKSILESENVDMTQGSALLELGKKGDTIGHAVTVHRGTELLALSEMESGIATLLPSICMIAITGISLLLSLM